MTEQKPDETKKKEDKPNGYAPDWNEIMRERERKLAEMRRRGQNGCLYGCPHAKEILSADPQRSTEILDYE